MGHRLPVQVWPFSVEVGAQLPFEGAHSMMGWLMGPTQRPVGVPPTLVYCLAGGGTTASVFDLQVPGFEDLSFARFLAARGVLVAAFDHPGIGRSAPVPDLYVLGVGAVASAHAHVVATLKDLISAGAVDLPLESFGAIRAIGLGHSMGGMVLDVIQAREGSFDAVVVLGHGGGGLPEVLTPAELALARTSGCAFDGQVEMLARARFAADSTVPRRLPTHGAFFGEDVPSALIAAMGEHQAELLYHCALQTLIPGSIASDMAAIHVPVFLGLGERDLIADPHSVVASYRGSPDVTLFVLAGAGHCQFQAGNRRVLWDRIERWLAALAAPVDGT
jgi:pimeloyl-ACP methyl ester carboxylesterase